jgi:hypothetical protein
LRITRRRTRASSAGRSETGEPVRPKVKGEPETGELRLAVRPYARGELEKGELRLAVRPYATGSLRQVS